MRRLKFLLIFLLTLYMAGRVYPQSVFLPNEKSITDSTNVVLQKAQVLYSEGEYVKAIEVIRSATSDTTSAKAFALLGMSYAGINDYENAFHFLRKACSADTSNIAYLYQLATFSIQSGAIEEAKKEYEHIVAADSDYLPALSQLAAIYYDQKSYERSQLYLKSILAINPRDYLANYYTGSILIATGHKDSAIAFLNRSVLLNSNFVPALDLLASLYYTRNDYTGAVALYQRASMLRPSTGDFIYKIGLCYRQEKDFEKAILYFKKAIAIDSSNATYYGQLGYCYYFTANYDSSAAFCIKAIFYDDQNSSYYSNLALAYQKLDSVEQEIGVYSKMIGLHHPDEISNLYYQIGSLYFSKNRMSEAIIAYKKALAIRPAYAAAFYFLGNSYEVANNIPAAIKAYEEFIQLTASDSTQKAMRESLKYRLKKLEQ